MSVIKERTCVACGRTSDKGDLVRFVRTADGVELDPTGRKAGRGAYLCPDMTCLTTARKRKGLERSLRTTIDPDAWERLGAGFQTIAATRGQA